MKKKAEWLKKFPYKELIKFNIIQSSNDISDLANSLLDFFNVSSPSIWDEYYSNKAISFRKSKNYKSSLHSTMTWLRIGEKLSEEIECKNFNIGVFKENLKEIKKLTKLSLNKFEPEIKKLCNDSGVALVLIPEFKGMRISGITEWLTPKKALILMSLRYKTNDHFWFTFFHEAGHIILHNKKDIFIDGIDNKDISDIEKEADVFARKTLINQANYDKFVESKKFYKNNIVKFANQNNIAPGIIVGMLQHDKLINYSWHNNLKEKFPLQLKLK